MIRPIGTSKELEYEVSSWDIQMWHYNFVKLKSVK